MRWKIIFDFLLRFFIMPIWISTEADKSQGSTLLEQMRQAGHESIELPASCCAPLDVTLWQKPEEACFMSVAQLVKALKVLP